MIHTVFHYNSMWFVIEQLFSLFDDRFNSLKTLKNPKKLIPEYDIEIIEIQDLGKSEEFSFLDLLTILYNGI